MIKARNARLLVMTACVGAALPRVAAAQENIKASATASTSVGYSTNPFSADTKNNGNGFAEIDIRPQLTLQTERDVFSLNGGVHYQRYFKRNSDSSSYAANFDYRGSPSQHVTTHLSLGFDSSIIGANDAIGGGPVDPTLPEKPVNTGVDLSLFGTRDRHRTFNANGDMAVSLSARDSFKVSSFFNASRYSRAGALGDNDGYGGTVGFDSQLSGHVRAGVQASIARTNYQGPLGDTKVYTGQATLSTTLSQRWNLDSAIGISFVNNSVRTSSSSFSGNLRLCRAAERATLCINARRAVLPTGISGTQNTTAVGGSYGFRVTERGSLSLSAEYTRNENGRSVGANPDEYVNASIGFEQQLRERLRLVTSARYRKIYGGSVKRPADFGGQLGIAIGFGGAK